MNLQLALLLFYAALMVALGLWIGRRVRTAGGFFVAGRRLDARLLFATVLAANIGAGSTVGAASLGYRDGLAAWWWVGSAGLGTLVLALWIGPRMWRIAAQHDFRTVGDYLEHRYGPSVRATVAGLLWLGTLALLAGQLMAMARILDAVAGVPYLVGCLLSSLVMVSYFVAGGLLTSAWVNLVQLVVLLVGFGVALPLAFAQAGGTEGLATLGATPGYWSFWQNGASGWMYAPLLIPAFFISPGLIQKAYGAKDERSVRLGIAASGVVLLVFAAIPPLLGIFARALYPGLENADLALPTLLAGLPVGVGTLGLAAVLSAEISSADAILFMLSTSLSQDLYRRFVNREASEEKVLQVARLTAVFGGLLGVGLAILLPTVIASLTIFYSLLGVSLFVPLIAGLHSRGKTRDAAIAIAVGVVALLVTRVAGGHGLWNPSLVALTASSLAFLAARALAPRTEG